MAFNSSSWYSFKSYEQKHPHYHQSQFSSVSLTALNYQATDRMKFLAKPKIRRETTIRDGFSRYISNPTYSGVSKAAANAQCSSRLSDLALPLKRYNSYEFEFSLPRAVSRAALQYQSSERINELASPKILPGVKLKF